MNLVARQDPLERGNLHDTWVKLWPLLEPAVNRSPDDPKVLTHLLSGEAELWAVKEGQVFVAGLVTWITQHSDGSCRLRVWLVGGFRVSDWLSEANATLEAYARERGCTAIYACGRRGWKNLAKKLDWKQVEPIDGFPTWSKDLA